MLGDLEDNLVKEKRASSDPDVMTLTEHLSYFEITVKIPDYHAEIWRDVLQTVINEYGAENFHSIPFDNCSEFSLLSRV